MIAPRRILVLSDTPDFGGHERAFFALLPGLLDSPRVEAVHIAISDKNKRLFEEISRIDNPKLDCSTTPFSKIKGEPFFAPLRTGFRSYVRQLMGRTRSDTLLTLQGRIENLCSVLFSPPRGVDVVSYIPMAHSIAEMGLRMGSTGLPDLVRRPYYARPQRFIVPSVAVTRQLAVAGAKGRTFVAPNVVSPPPRLPRDEARRMLDLPLDGHVALFMGRFDTHQKGLDLLSRAIARSTLEGWRFVFVGAGPGLEAVKVGLGAAKGPDAVRFIPWTDAPHAALSAADALMMPSRFEGVPLVMLEAMSLGAPIVGSRIDVYQEYLPAEALIDFSADGALDRALALTVDPDFLARYRAQAAATIATLDIRTSRATFLAGVLGESA